MLPKEELAAEGDEACLFPSSRGCLGHEVGQAAAQCKPKQEEQQCAHGQMARGEVQCPLFQDLQTTILPEEPVGSQSEESLDEGE